MKLESQIAWLTLRSQPKTIRDRLLHHGELQSELDLTRGSYPGLGSFKYQDIVNALNKIHLEGRAAVVRTTEGKDCRLEQLPEGIYAALVEGDAAGRIVPEFGFLSPNDVVRRKVFSDILADLWPWFPSADKWRSLLDERLLSDRELTQLVDEIQSSPNYFLAALQDKWQRGQVDVQDIVPRSPFYYRALLGPLPDSHNVDDYIQEIFKPHLKMLIRHDLSIGLEICLPAYLRDDIAPYSLLEGVDDKAVLEVLQKFQYLDNPFTLLGILDIAIRRRMSDENFSDVVSNISLRLTHHSLIGRDGVNSYELMPPLVRLCYRQLSIDEALYDTPPYWRLLAAFVHVNFLLEVLRTRSLMVDKFSSWCESKVTDRIIIKQLLDMQSEPLGNVDYINATTLRAEIVGRLWNLSAAIRHEDESLALWNQIEGATQELQEQSLLIFAMCPGPLESHLRRKGAAGLSATAEAVAADLIPKISADLEISPTGDVWNKLAVFTRIFYFDAELLGKLEAALQSCRLADDEEDRQPFFNVVTSAAFIAATQPAESLADTVAKVLVRAAVNCTTDRDAESGFRILLIASSSFSSRTTRLDWLEQKLTDYVYSLPKGAPCVQLYKSLHVLQTLLPINEWHFGRATKLAAAALR